MKKVFFDLEWNTGFLDGNSYDEIIEIGAVKTDEEYRQIDGFRRLVRPTIYRKMNPYIQKILAITMNDLQDADRDQRRLEHRQDDEEERAHRAAAVDGSGFLNFQRNGFYKAAEHEHRETRAEAEINDRDRPRGIETEPVRRAGEREHDHLERDDHGEHAEIIYDLAEEAPDAGNIPRGHGRAHENERRGGERDEKAVAHGLQKRVVAEGHALDIVLEADKAVRVREGKRLRVDGGVALEGVHQNDEDRHNVSDADHREDDRQHHFAAFFSLSHYCCTSFLRVAWSCRRPIAATRMKNTTAFAWPTPRLLPPPE